MVGGHNVLVMGTWSPHTRGHEVLVYGDTMSSWSGHEVLMVGDMKSSWSGHCVLINPSSWGHIVLIKPLPRGHIVLINLLLTVTCCSYRFLSLVHSGVRGDIWCLLITITFLVYHVSVVSRNLKELCYTEKNLQAKVRITKWLTKMTGKTTRAIGLRCQSCAKRTTLAERQSTVG